MNVVHTFFTVPGAVLILILAWRVLNMIWLKPRKAEKLLRKQGLRGNSYRFLYGDKKDISRMESEARAKPIHFTHDIVPRVLPFIHKTINTFGIFHFCLDFYYQLTFLIFQKNLIIICRGEFVYMGRTKAFRVNCGSRTCKGGVIKKLYFSENSLGCTK